MDADLFDPYQIASEVHFEVENFAILKYRILVPRLDVNDRGLGVCRISMTLVSNDT